MLGVGGIDDVVSTLHERVWLPHVAPRCVTTRFGCLPPAGLLLHGPPGCGKSLLAVRLANCLSPIPPRIVKGPELKNSRWGQDEKGIRELFKPIKGSRKWPGALSVVILDEADALLHSRSPGGNYDMLNSSNVTQFLSCMDGAQKRMSELQGDETPHLLIALTNRREVLDPALLRPGRFEVQLWLPEPDEQGRCEILRYETADLRANGAITSEAVEYLAFCAEMTTGFSGADIAGMVRISKSIALNRAIKRLPESAFDGSALVLDEACDEDEDDDDEPMIEHPFAMLGQMLSAKDTWQEDVIKGMRDDDFSLFKRGIKKSKGKIEDAKTYDNSPDVRRAYGDISGYYQLEETASGTWLNTIGVSEGMTALDIAKKLPPSQSHFAAHLEVHLSEAQQKSDDKASDGQATTEYVDAMAVQIEKQDLWEAMQTAKTAKRNLLTNMLDDPNRL